MRSDLEDNLANRVKIFSARLGTEVNGLETDVTLTNESPLAHLYDPQGVDKTITLPLFRRGLIFIIGNSGSSGDLIIQDSGLSPVATLPPGALSLLLCSGNDWQFLAGDATTPIGVFGPSGPGHSTGLVPDPGAIAGTQRILHEDGLWKLPGLNFDDAYSFVTDGITTIPAVGADTISFYSLHPGLALVTSTTIPVPGKNVVFGLLTNQIDHNDLLNYVPNEHIDHSTIDFTPGNGLFNLGGTDLTTDLSFILDVDGLPSFSVMSPTFTLPVGIGTQDTRKITFSDFVGNIDHDALLNFVANEHIDHTGVAIIAGVGLSGGGTIDTTQTIDLAIPELDTETTIAPEDLLPFYDITGVDHAKITFFNFQTALGAISTISEGAGIDVTSPSSTERTIAMDPNGLTTVTLDPANDFVVIADASNSGAPRKALLTPAVVSSSIVSSSPSTTPQNNFSPTGWTSVAATAIANLRLTPTISFTLAGLVPGSALFGRIINATDPAGSDARMIILTHEDTNSTAANRFSFSDRMPRFLFPGDTIDIWYDTTSSRWRPVVFSVFQSAFHTYDDFAATTFPTFYAGSNTGTGSASEAITNYLSTNTTQQPFGQLGSTVGTTATGGSMLSGPNNLHPTKGFLSTLHRLAVDTLSTSVQRYRVFSGLFNIASGVGAAPTVGVGWRYWEESSANWVPYAINGANNTTQATTLTVDLNYIWLGTFLNGDATRAEYFWSQNGANWNWEAAITTALALPTISTPIRDQAAMIKTVGTVSRTLYHDLQSTRFAMIRGS